jgi:hypothetical protein
MNNIKSIVRKLINEMDQYNVLEDNMRDIGNAIEKYEYTVEELVFNHPSMNIYMKEEVLDEIRKVKTALGNLQNVVDRLTDDHFIDHDNMSFN